MDNNIIFFTPVPKITIWGGDTLKNFFGYTDFPDSVGQCWAFNALGKDANKALGEHSKDTLLSLFEEHPELFCSKYDKFPFIISLVGPEDDLSIQVHPDDVTGKRMGYSGGKNEAWYFISTPESYDIVYDHNAKNKADLLEYMKDGKWQQLVCHLPIDSEEAVYIPAGTLHAMRKGAVVYEIQQAVDVTFRFYDYDRVDSKGQKRELQTEAATECLHYEKAPGISAPHSCKIRNAEITDYIRNDSFTVRRWRVNGSAVLPLESYAVATVTAGSGIIDGEKIALGDNFLISALRKEHEVSGQFDILMTME